MNFIRVRQFFSSEGHFFESNIKYLVYVGLWSNENWSKMHLIFYKIYEVTLHILSIFFLVITAIGTLNIKNDMPLLISNLDKSLVAYNFVFKVAFFVFKRDRLKRLIEEITISGDEITEERKRLMRIHVYAVAGLCTSVVSTFSGLALLKGEMTIEAWMPFDPMKNRMNLLLAAQILAFTVLVPCLYRSIAMQGLVCSLMMYVCDQLKDLQVKLIALKYTVESEKAVREEFKSIVKKHVRLMRYAALLSRVQYSKSMSMIFKEYFLIQNLAVTVELCLNAVMVAVVGLQDVTLLVSFLSFLAAALLIAYIFCYLGNELIIQSQGVALAAYESPWTGWPLDLQKDLLTVLRVAQRPLQLSAGGIANMSIETFAQSLYNGYSIFAVLNDVVD